MAALDDSPRPGREPVVTDEARTFIVDLACRNAVFGQAGAHGKAAALKFLKRIMKKYGRPLSVVTDGLCSYPAAMKEIGNADRQEAGRRLNNRAENSHQPFRRRERVVSCPKTMSMVTSTVKRLSSSTTSSASPASAFFSHRRRSRSETVWMLG